MRYIVIAFEAKCARPRGREELKTVDRPGSRTLKDHVLLVTGGKDGIDDFARYRLAACEDLLAPNFFVPSTPLATV